LLLFSTKPAERILFLFLHYAGTGDIRPAGVSDARGLYKIVTAALSAAEECFNEIAKSTFFTAR
jgi:hypothetical protein